MCFGFCSGKNKYILIVNIFSIKKTIFKDKSSKLPLPYWQRRIRIRITCRTGWSDIRNQLISFSASTSGPLLASLPPSLYSILFSLVNEMNATATFNSFPKTILQSFSAREASQKLDQSFPLLLYQVSVSCLETCQIYQKSSWLLFFSSLHQFSPRIFLSKRGMLPYCFFL